MVVLLLKKPVLSVRSGFFLSWAPVIVGLVTPEMWLYQEFKGIPIPPRWAAQMVGCPKVVSVFPFPDNRGGIPGLMSVDHRVFGGYNLQGPGKVHLSFSTL